MANAKAARINDFTEHGTPLAPGPGSRNVRIGNQPAWRAVASGPLQVSLEAASDAAAALMSAPLLDPTAAAPQLARLHAGLQQAGLDAAVQGDSGAPAAAASAAASLTAANTALTAAWTAASAAPGGQPAANVAYTKGLQAAVAGSASAVFAHIGGTVDLHNCPLPCPAGPHGPGVVTRGSRSVRVNNLPIARQGDKVVEACGGSDPIAVGCESVYIGE